MDHIYTSCYCEENVYFLLHRINGSAVFVSNESRTVPFWCQKSQTNESNPVIWDYHCFAIKYLLLLNTELRDGMVYDQDSMLTFPTPILEFAEKALRIDLALPPGYERKFRVVDRYNYHLYFSSDRSHMLKDGVYQATPPTYPCIDKGIPIFYFFNNKDHQTWKYT